MTFPFSFANSVGLQSGSTPVAPAFTAPVNQEIITEDAAYVVTVTSTGDSSVNLYDGVSLIGAMTNAGGGVWTYSWTPTSPDYDVQLNAVGDVSGQGETLTIVVAEANLISQNFSTGWTKTRVTVSGSQTDPDGGSTAYRAVMGNNAGTSFFINNTSAVTAPSVFNSGFELWVKPDGVTKMMIYPLEDGGADYAYIDITNKYMRTNRAYCKIVQEKNGWYRIWFNFFENAAAGPRNFYIYFCSTFGTTTGTFTGTEAIYLWKPRTAQQGQLPLTAYQKLSIEYVSVASGQERWEYNHPYIDSPANVTTTRSRIDVIKPTGWTNSGNYPVVYALPALPRASEPTRDVAATFVLADYANTYNCVIVVPYDRGVVPGWYGLKDDNTVNTHAWMAEAITGFAQEFLGASTDREKNLLIGYSKSANGAFSLLLRNPTKFGYACGWDGVWNLDWATEAASVGANTAFGTQAQYELYAPYNILTSYLSSVNDKTRLVLIGYETWQTDQTDMKTLLDNNSIGYSYDATDRGAHSYAAGWLDDGMARLMSIAGLD